MVGLALSLTPLPPTWLSCVCLTSLNLCACYPTLAAFHLTVLCLLQAVHSNGPQLDDRILADPEVAAAIAKGKTVRFVRGVDLQREGKT